MKKLETLLAGVIIGGLICMMLFALTSCRSVKYGCPGQGSGMGYVGYK